MKDISQSIVRRMQELGYPQGTYSLRTVLIQLFQATQKQIELPGGQYWFFDVNTAVEMGLDLFTPGSALPVSVRSQSNYHSFGSANNPIPYPLGWDKATGYEHVRRLWLNYLDEDITVEKILNTPVIPILFSKDGFAMQFNLNIFATWIGSAFAALGSDVGAGPWVMNAASNTTTGTDLLKGYVDVNLSVLIEPGAGKITFQFTFVGDLNGTTQFNFTYDPFVSQNIVEFPNGSNNLQFYLDAMLINNVPANDTTVSFKFRFETYVDSETPKVNLPFVQVLVHG